MRKLSIYEGKTADNSYSPLVNLAQPLSNLRELVVSQYFFENQSLVEAFSKLLELCKKICVREGQLERVLFRCNNATMSLLEVAQAFKTFKDVTKILQV